jgi:hypothetical protein
VPLGFILRANLKKIFKNGHVRPSMVAHVCNSSYAGEIGLRSKPGPDKNLRLYLKKN